MYPENIQQYVPPEFDLAKYEKAANMELVNWLENLTARVSGYLLDEDLIENLGERQLKFISEQTEKNINYGVHSSDNYEKFLSLMKTKDDAQYSSVVRDVTYFDLMRISDSVLTSAHQKQYSKLNHQIFAYFNQDSLGILNQKISIPTLDDENPAWLEIDMNCSETEILAAFKNWLKDYRHSNEDITKSRERTIKIFSPANFRNWHLAKVLPYIDLVTWNKLRGNKPNSYIFSKILYPDPKDISDKARKIDDTTLPHVTKLMSPDTLRRMMKILFSQNRK